MPKHPTYIPHRFETNQTPIYIYIYIEVHTMLLFYWFTSIKSQTTVNKKANSLAISLISLNMHIQAKIHRPNLLKITQATHFSTKTPKFQQSSSESWLLKTSYALFQLFLSALKSLISFKMRKKIHSQTQETLPYPFLQKKL